MASSSYGLFSDPDCFTSNGIRNAVHYIHDEITGTLWLDDIGDGRRGDSNDELNNAMETTFGIGGVKVQLMDCASDVPLSNADASATSEDSKGIKGLYSLQINAVQAGRYYLMYQAPNGYRISGNTLPLERSGGNDLSDFSCVPRGGEGGVGG